MNIEEAVKWSLNNGLGFVAEETLRKHFTAAMAPTPHAPGEETPETDAKVFNAPILDSTMRSIPFDAVSADFARSLERRLRAALAERDDETQKAVDKSCKLVIHHWRERVIKMEAELSEARKDTDRLDWLEVVGTKGEEFHWTPTYKGHDLRAAIDRGRETPPFDQPPENA